MPLWCFLGLFHSVTKMFCIFVNVYHIKCSSFFDKLQLFWILFSFFVWIFFSQFLFKYKANCWKCLNTKCKASWVYLTFWSMEKQTSRYLKAFLCFDTTYPRPCVPTGVDQVPSTVLRPDPQLSRGFFQLSLMDFLFVAPLRLYTLQRKVLWTIQRQQVFKVMCNLWLVVGKSFNLYRNTFAEMISLILAICWTSSVALQHMFIRTHSY